MHIFGCALSPSTHQQLLQLLQLLLLQQQLQVAAGRATETGGVIAACGRPHGGSQANTDSVGADHEGNCCGGRRQRRVACRDQGAQAALMCGRRLAWVRSMAGDTSSLGCVRAVRIRQLSKATRVVDSETRRHVRCGRECARARRDARPPLRPALRAQVLDARLAALEADTGGGDDAAGDDDDAYTDDNGDEDVCGADRAAPACAPPLADACVAVVLLLRKGGGEEQAATKHAHVRADDVACCRSRECVLHSLCAVQRCIES